ncbi:MAG: type III pantothenate kinase [Intestinimonas sp.]|jgi:type III pantothenate kinase|nr:type III pantothenate kinase [Intestinimonas sp.]
MVLAIDIGNTTITVGGFMGGVLTFVHRLPSDRGMSDTACASGIRNIMLCENVNPDRVEDAILASVVPVLTDKVCKAVRSAAGVPTAVVSPETDTGLKIRNYDAGNLGSDRVVDAVAALAQWNPPLVIFDMGTATTMSVLDREGVFLGGMILPGLRLSVDALSARAAQLPDVEFTPPAGLIGTDTISCMQYGALYGAASAIEGIAQRVEENLGHSATVILTGGLSRHILPCLRRHVEYDEHLLLKGLHHIYLRNR